MVSSFLILQTTHYGNTIKNNVFGIRLGTSSNNRIYHNNLIDNTQHAYIETSGYANFWDNGYPSGGNYWSDYADRYPDAEEINESGIWNTPYEIDENNIDKYPLVPEFPTWISLLVILTMLTVATAIYKRRSLKTTIH